MENFKRFFVFILAISLVLVLMDNGVAEDGLYVYTSNGKPLNIRATPSINADVVGSIPYGTLVDYDPYTSITGWYHVFYKGNDGYCMARYFVVDKPSAKPAGATTAQHSQAVPNNGDRARLADRQYEAMTACDFQAIVRPSTPGGYVHLRWAPGKDQLIQRNYYSGDVLNVIARSGSWSQVYDEGIKASGYIMSAFLVATN